MIGQKGSLLSVEIIAVAMAAIRANAMRSMLTTLGIIIGVAAVITMVSMGEGAQQQIQSQIQGMGMNILSISPARSHGMGGVRGGSSRLYLDDAIALRDNSGGLEDDSSEDGYEIRVFDAFGNEMWNDEVESVSGSETASHTYAGPPLQSGMLYQFRVTSFREPNNGPRTAISTTEDLKGVFIYKSGAPPE